MKEFTCIVCGKIILDYPSTNRKTCSQECKYKSFGQNEERSRKLSVAHTGRKRSAEELERINKTRSRGDKHWRWKGGRFVKSGTQYILVLVHGHPYANRHGYVREHRLVVEKHIGRYLTPNEHVHHKDGNKQNNKIENLVILTNSQHAHIGLPPIKQQDVGRNGTWFVVLCNQCKKQFEVAGYVYRSGHGKFCTRDCYFEYQRENKK